MSTRNLLIFSSILIVIGIAGRLLPHPWNTTPVTALILFASVYLGFRYSLMVLLVIMFVTDSLLGFYQWQVMVSVYVSLVVAGIIAQYIRQCKTIGSVLLTTLGSSLLFFLITNWAVWQFSSMYEHTFAGLMQSYVLAIPFFKHSLVGDVLYTGMLFMGYEAICFIVSTHIKTPAWKRRFSKL